MRAHPRGPLAVSLRVGIAMPSTRTTQSVGPVLGSRYPVDARLVSDESNLKDRQGAFIVYNKPSGVGGASFEAVMC